MSETIRDERDIISGPQLYELGKALLDRPNPPWVHFTYMPTAPDDTRTARIKVRIDSLQALDKLGTRWNIEGIARIVPPPGTELIGKAKKSRRVHILYDVLSPLAGDSTLKFLT